MNEKESAQQHWGKFAMPDTPWQIDHSKAGMATCSEPIRSGQLSSATNKHTGPAREQTVDDLIKGQIEHLEGRLTRLRAAQLNAFLLNVLDAPAARFRQIANEL